MEKEEKWAGWDNGRNIIKSHGCLIMVDKVALFPYDMEIEKRQG